MGKYINKTSDGKILPAAGKVMALILDGAIRVHPLFFNKKNKTI